MPADQIDDLIDVLQEKSRSNKITWTLLATNVIRLGMNAQIIDVSDDNGTYGITIRTPNAVVITTKSYLPQDPCFPRIKDLFDSVKHDLVPTHKVLTDIIQELKQR